jgi:hypothetical protein
MVSGVLYEIPERLGEVIRVDPSPKGWRHIYIPGQLTPAWRSPNDGDHAFCNIAHIGPRFGRPGIKARPV